MRRKTTLFAVFGFIIFFAIEAQAADWVYYATGSADGCSFYYDPQSIKRVSEDIVQVWEKKVFTEKDAKKAINELGPEFKELSFDKCLKEFNCNEKKSRTLSVIYYNKDGGVIESVSSASSWDFVVPDSGVEALFNIVCGGH